MIDFIKRHWIAYLIGAVIAVILGAGASYIVGVKGSTPADVRAERRNAELKDEEARDELNQLEQSGSAAESASE